MEVVFKFERFQQVKIKALENLAGTVDARMVEDNCGMQYRVIYWVNNERKTVWVYEWEIE